MFKEKEIKVENQSLVSVIIPTYNNGHVIARALDSLFSQIYENLEIIVVDDGSTDGTKDVVLKVAERFPKKKIIFEYQENSGVSAARNKGIDIARGEYICFLDSDDTLSNHSISKRVESLKRHPDIDIVFSDVFVRNKIDGYWLKNTDFLKAFRKNIERSDGEEYVLDGNFYKKFFDFSPYPICTQAIMMKRTCFDSGLRFALDLPSAQDVFLWFEILKGKRSVYINEALAIYYREDSTLTKGHETSLLCNIRMFEKLLAMSDCSEVFGVFKRNLSQFYFYLSYFYRSKKKMYDKALSYAVKSIILNPFRFLVWRNFLACIVLMTLNRKK
ncbi:MAG: glycosyltransferase [Candidatus Omnitrophica bacterium]|nr:glycosyltransferase [Candidatus Omnitrophota bacterium]